MSNDLNDSASELPGEQGKLCKYWKDERVERELLPHDIASTIAHVMMLGETGIIERAAADEVLHALRQIEGELAEGKSYLSPDHTDIHAALEERLSQMVGDLVSYARMAKSSNDQIATDIRLWLRQAVLDIFVDLIFLRGQFVALAERDLEIVMPGYTHMQPAMPILLSHWWLANEARFRRDSGRLADFYRRFNVLPLGSGALAGTSQPIDRRLVASYLHFDDVIENSLYAVSDRDFLVEFASFASLVGLHISQIGSDLLLWSTQEYGFVRLRHGFLSSSRSMPQKRNPVVLEVLRSRPSAIFGKLVEFVTALKALPSGFCQDLQESLPGLIDLVGNLKFSLELLRAVLPAVEVNAERMKEMASADLTNASAAVSFLVSGGMPHDRARKVVEQLVNYCKQRNKYLADLNLSEWQQFSPAFDDEIYSHVTVEQSVGSQTSFGGTALEQVSVAIAMASEKLATDKAELPGLAREQLERRERENPAGAELSQV